VERTHESYGDGPASHTGPESCMTVCEDRREALTGKVQADSGQNCALNPRKLGYGLWAGALRTG
jgi:hypothetical protein